MTAFFKSKPIELVLKIKLIKEKPFKEMRKN